jgi:hypothetical protein
MIEQYSFGSMTIDGEEYTSDLMIINGRVYPSWWRKSGHVVEITDVEKVLAGQPKCLVVGTGSAGLMKITEQLRQHLDACAVELAAAPTAQAVVTFCKLHAAGEKVSAVFHLTC